MKFCKRIFCAILAVFLFSGAAAVNASAAGGVIKSRIGFVNASNLNMRSGASKSKSIVDVASRGEVVVILHKTGNWYKVIYNLREGYMHADYLKTYTRENVELGYGSVNGNGVNLRTGPGTGYRSVAKSYENEKAYIIGFNTGWYKVIYGEKICYIRSDYLDLTEIPYENADSLQEPLFFRGGKSTGIAPSAQALRDRETPVTADKVLTTARKYIGVPYVWGGSTPSGFDCSGYTQYVLNQHGVVIPRTTDTQYQVGIYVSRDELRPGDLVFFENTYRAGISHVGFYIGDDQFIHASSSKGVTISSLDAAYYATRYYGARRILP